MASTPQRGPGIGVNLQALVGSNFTSRYGQYNSNVDALALGSGETFLIPSGQWMVTPGPYSFIQVKDPVSRVWRSISQTPNSSRYVSSDGTNYRVANLTGCALGATVTTVGSGYTNSTVGSDGNLTNTNAIAVAASAGSSVWTAIVGGAINTSVTVATAGAGYTHKPILLIEPPPPGGVQATAVAVVSGGAITSVTVLDQGAGYQSAPRITVVPDPRDTVTTEAALTTALTGSGTLTALLCTDHGTPLTSVATLSFSGGGGSSAAATVVGCYALTGITVTDGGTGYGNAQPVGIQTIDGRCAATPGTVTNPSFGNNLLQPRQALGRVTSTAGGLITATGFRITDAGLFSAVPFVIVTAGGSGLATDTGEATATIGGVDDQFYLQPA